MPRTLVLLLLSLLALVLPARAAPDVGADDAPGTARIEVYTHPTCPHCAAAKRWLVDLAEARPDVEIVVHDVAAEPAAMARLEVAAEAHGVASLGVPAFIVGDHLVLGFDGPEGTGAQLEALLVAPAAARDPTITVPLVGEIDPTALGLPLFTIALGLIDGFNPCATWVLLFVLSLLVHLESRARMLAVGGTFVLVSGLAYFAFMEAWLSFYLLVGISRGVQVGLGLVAVAVGAVHVKDFFALGTGPSLSIPARAKPGIVRRARAILRAENLPAAVGAAAVLAVMVNVVELLCTAGLPAVYTEVLSSHDLPRWQHHAWIGVYNLAYMLDDAVLLTVATVTLRRTKLQERGGRWLKLLSGAVMAILGLLLLFWPDALRW